MQEFDEHGRFLRQFGVAGVLPGELRHPVGIARDGEGRLYVADAGNNRVQVFTGDGEFLRAFGSEGAGDGEFTHPTGVAVGGDERIHVTDREGHRIQIFTNEGQFLKSFGHEGTMPGEYRSPADLIFDAYRQLYIADTHNDRLQRTTADGTTTAVIGRRGQGLGEFRLPQGVAIDLSSSFLYVADTHNNRVIKFPIRATAPVDEIPPIAEIHAPGNEEVVSGVVDVSGIAADAYFKRHRLEYGAGVSASAFSLIVESETPVWNGGLGTWDATGLSPGPYVLRLSVEDHVGNVSEDSVAVELVSPALTRSGNMAMKPRRAMPRRRP